MNLNPNIIKDHHFPPSVVGRVGRRRAYYTAGVSQQNLKRIISFFNFCGNIICSLSYRATQHAAEFQSTVELGLPSVIQDPIFFFIVENNFLSRYKPKRATKLGIRFAKSELLSPQERSHTGRAISSMLSVLELN